MIDLHLHILYDLDDGAVNEEMTLNMLRIAADDGIRAIVATPHYICGASRYDCKKMVQAYNRASELIEKHNLQIRLYMGNEVFLDEYTLDSINNRKCHTLAGTRYVLIELPMRVFALNTQNLIYGIINSGYIPILAHPERYLQIQQDMGILRRLISAGCITQINSLSIRGVTGKKAYDTARKILKSNMGHLVATDAHSHRLRSPVLKECFETVKDWIGEEKAVKIFYKNTETILEDRELELDPVIDIKRNSLFSILKGWGAALLVRIMGGHKG